MLEFIVGFIIAGLVFVLMNLYAFDELKEKHRKKLDL